MKIFRYILACLVICTGHANELLFINNLKTVLSLDDQTYSALVLQADTTTNCSFKYYDHYLPLFALYPLLQISTPYISLGSLPTPIKRLTQLEKVYGINNFFIKQDSLSGGIQTNGKHLFGGNKVRKLEFLLADALSYNAKSVLTFGCIGSNHAVAVATYAQRCGLRCYCMLTPQSNSTVVQRNLALMYSAGAEIVQSANAVERKENTVKAFIDSKNRYGDYPYFIPTGGSTALGAVGFVNAAFELQEQVNTGLLLEPDYIYVAAGSFGTVAGLALGLKVVGMRTQVVAVCVAPETVPGSVVQRINTLFKDTNKLLHSRDASFPWFNDGADNVTVIHGFGGPGYGVFSQEAMDAMRVVEEYEGIILDGTYTGKAFAALISHAQTGMFVDKNVLFWNTFCSDGL